MILGLVSIPLLSLLKPLCGFEGIALTWILVAGCAALATTVFLLRRALSFYLRNEQIVPQDATSWTSLIAHAGWTMLIPLTAVTAVELFAPPIGIVTTFVPSLREDQARWTDFLRAASKSTASSSGDRDDRTPVSPISGDSRSSKTTTEVPAKQGTEEGGGLIDGWLTMSESQGGVPSETLQGDAFVRVPSTAKLLSDAVVTQSFFPATPRKQSENKVLRLGTSWLWTLSDVEWSAPDVIASRLVRMWAYKDGHGAAKECDDQEPSIEWWRLSDGCVCVAATLPGDTDRAASYLTWLPELKLGCKMGDRWRFEGKLGTTLTFEVVGIFELRGAIIAVVKKEGILGKGRIRSVTWYCRGVGMVRQQLFNNVENKERLEFASAVARKMDTCDDIHPRGVGEDGGDSPSSSPADSPPLQPVGGRALTVNINTAGKNDMLTQTQNACLHSVGCVATADSVVIDCDVDTSQWVPINGRLHMMVRLFDKNGQYLTHFVTAEGFTATIGVYEGLEETRRHLLRSGLTDQAAKVKCILLKPKGNRFIYPVNVRDLRDASVVEIGFLQTS